MIENDQTPRVIAGFLFAAERRDLAAEYADDADQKRGTGGKSRRQTADGGRRTAGHEGRPRIARMGRIGRGEQWTGDRGQGEENGARMMREVELGWVLYLGPYALRRTSTHHRRP
jgi:hypothetical protein